jgi:hypothetical protein
MEWDEATAMGVIVLLLVVCELAVCAMLVVALSRMAWGWWRRRRLETLDRVPGFDVKLTGEPPARPAERLTEQGDVIG